MADGDNSSKSPRAEADKLRQLFHAKYSTSELLSKGVYDQRDVDNIASNDLYVSQFIRPIDSLQDAVERVHETLKWRKEIKIRDVTEAWFERESFEKGAAFFHNHDKDGRKLFWLKVKLHKREPARMTEVKQFIARFFEEHYNESPEDEIVILFDLSNAGVSNIDLEFIKFIITAFKVYYPQLLGYMLIYEMPWVFNAAWKIIKSWLSAEAVAKLKFVVKGDVQEYIDKDQLPEYMGGTDTWRYKYVPPEERTEEESKTLATKKKVTFADQDQTMYQSITADDNVNNSAGTETKSKPSPAIKAIQNRSPVKREAGDDNAFIGRLLTITPAEELEITKEENGSESYGVISLKNTLPYSIAFKVKTTSPEKYKVRPSAGVVKPGSAVEVYVYLHQGYQYTASKDKFLIMAMELTGDTPDNLAELWKTVPRENIMEHRLKCVQVNKSSSNQNADYLSESKADQLQRLTKQVESLVQSNKRMEMYIRVMMILQIVFMLLFLYQTFFPTFTKDTGNTNSTAGYCSGSWL